MNRTLLQLLIFFIAFAGTVTAQSDESSFTSKGRILLGTSLGASYTGVSIDGQDDNLSQINIELDGGYFFANNLVVGIASGYTHTKLGDGTNWSLNIGPFARYYWKSKVFFGAG